MDAVNQQLVGIMGQTDEVDSEIRAQLDLSPARFPTNVSPIERNLQYLIDVLELMENKKQQHTVIRERLQSMRLSEAAVLQMSQEHTVSFDAQNPFEYVVDEENDYVFDETKNNFYQAQVQYVRPFF